MIHNVVILNQRVQRRDETISELSTRIHHELLFLKQGSSTEEVRARMILEEKQKQLKLQEYEEKVLSLEDTLRSKDSEITQLKSKHRTELERLQVKYLKQDTEMIALKELIYQKDKERELLMNTLSAKDMRLLEMQRETEDVSNSNAELNRKNAEQLKTIEEMSLEREKYLHLLDEKEAESVACHQSIEDNLKAHEAQSQRIGVLGIQLSDQKARWVSALQYLNDVIQVCATRE